MRQTQHNNIILVIRFYWHIWPSAYRSLGEKQKVKFCTTRAKNYANTNTTGCSVWPKHNITYTPYHVHPDSPPHSHYNNCTSWNSARQAVSMHTQYIMYNYGWLFQELRESGGNWQKTFSHCFVAAVEGIDNMLFNWTTSLPTRRLEKTHPPLEFETHTPNHCMYVRVHQYHIIIL